jgi:hypothetical protein
VCVCECVCVCEREREREREGESDRERARASVCVCECARVCVHTRLTPCLQTKRHGDIMEMALFRLCHAIEMASRMRLNLLFASADECSRAPSRALYKL